MSGELVPGTRLRKYEIREVLGRGGMGIVYKAWDPDIHMDVAIKWMDASHAPDPQQMAESFRNEAQTYARLNHSGLVPYRDYIIEGSNLYMVTAYIEGQTLEQLLKRTGYMSESRGIQMALHLLDALGYAHSRQVIHRDLKPANIMIPRDGIPVILDFGISKSGGATANTQFIAAQAYSLYYAPPEQIVVINQGVHTSPASDIYSLGVVMAQAIAGLVDKGVIPENSAQRLIHETVKTLPGLSPELSNIVMKAINPHMVDRYQSAEEMSRALKSISGGGVVVIPSSPSPPTGDPDTSIDKARETVLKTGFGKRSKVDFRK